MENPAEATEAQIDKAAADTVPTVWDASSSRGTLFIMLVVTVVFLPIVAGCTTWVYRMLRGTISPEYVTERSDSLY